MSFNVVTSSRIKYCHGLESAARCGKNFSARAVTSRCTGNFASAISHLASFPSLANALIGLLLIGKLVIGSAK